jgi:hypothetical protein
MSTNPAAPKSSRTPYFLIAGLSGCIVLLVCIGIGLVGVYFARASGSPVAAPTSVAVQPPTAPSIIPVASPPKPPTAPAEVPFASPTVAPTSGGSLATYHGSGAAFSVQYPANWDLIDQEKDTPPQVTFIAPGKKTSANISYGAYRAGSSLADAFDQTLTTVFKATRTIAKTTNPDQSFSAEIERTDPTLGQVHAYIRMLAAGSTYIIAQCNISVDEFDQYKDIGKALVDSVTISPLTSVNLATYTGIGAPFSIRYPNSWQVQSQETGINPYVVIFAPSQAAGVVVTYIQAGSNDPKRYIESLVAQLIDVKIIAETQNPDNSITVEVEHTVQQLGGRVHGYYRVLSAGGTFYVAEFNAVSNEFDLYKTAGKTMVDSLTAAP